MSVSETSERLRSCPAMHGSCTLSRSRSFATSTTNACTPTTRSPMETVSSSTRTPHSRLRTTTAANLTYAHEQWLEHPADDLVLRERPLQAVRAHVSPFLKVLCCCPVRLWRTCSRKVPANRSTRQSMAPALRMRRLVSLRAPRIHTRMNKDGSESTKMESEREQEKLNTHRV